MSPEFLAVLNQLPLHTILMVGIIVLWRENRRLAAKLEDVLSKQTLHTAMLADQNKALSQIHSQIRQ